MLRVEHGAAYGSRLVTTVPVRLGDVVARITHYRVSPEPTYRSIQTGRDTHIDDLGDLCYLNHSCAPSVLVDTDRMAVIAARDLRPGDELAFFYPSTEWEMTRPFPCLCGAAGCLGTISGAKDASVDALERNFLNRHIREMLAERDGSAPSPTPRPPARS
jgi:hypothetical protein